MLPVRHVLAVQPPEHFGTWSRPSQDTSHLSLSLGKPTWSRRLSESSARTFQDKRCGTLPLDAESMTGPQSESFPGMMFYTDPAGMLPLDHCESALLSSHQRPSCCFTFVPPTQVSVMCAKAAAELDTATKVRKAWPPCHV